MKKFLAGRRAPRRGRRAARAADGDRDARPGADAGRGFREIGQGVDDAAVLHQPAGRSPAEGAGHSVAEGRARLSHRRARQADLLRRHPASTTARSAAASPRVKVETIGNSDEDRELVVVWVSSDENITEPAEEPRQPREDRRPARPVAAIRSSSSSPRRKPHTTSWAACTAARPGPSEMLMELAYRLATETSPLITQIRDNVIVSITPVADPDGRDRNVDWFYQGLGAATGWRPLEPLRPARPSRVPRRQVAAGA